MFKNEWERDGPMCTNKHIKLIHRCRPSRDGLWSRDAGLMSVTEPVQVGGTELEVCVVRFVPALFFPKPSKSRSNLGNLTGLS